MASRCLVLAAETSDEQHKSVLLCAAAKLNEWAARQESGMHRYRPIGYYGKKAPFRESWNRGRSSA
jgi:hypothetical protein